MNWKASCQINPGLDGKGVDENFAENKLMIKTRTLMYTKRRRIIEENQNLINIEIFSIKASNYIKQWIN